MTRVYFRCNGGHYFAATLDNCPLDGWASSESGQVAEITRRLTAAGTVPSIERLSKSGLSQDAIARTIIIEFGSEQSAFDAIAPEGYYVDGQWKVLRKLGPDFL